MLFVATVAVLTASCTTYAYPHFGGYPRFYDEEHPLDQPTVNVFKIYAPRLFYMPGYKSPMHNRNVDFKKNKQMISSSEIMLNDMMKNEVFPDSLFNEEANSIFDYEDDFVPQPSNIVSRKLPPYAPHMAPPMMHAPFAPPMMHARFAPSMHLDDYPPMMGNHAREFIDDIPDYYDLHDENCEHHMLFQPFNTHMGDAYPDYPNVQFLDPIFMNDMPLQKPIDGPAFPIFSPSPSGPLTTFFKKFVSKPIIDDNIKTEVLTTVSFGEPEIVKDEKKNIAAQIEKLNNEHIESDITVIITEELPSTSLEDNDIEEEIERHFVKTILPDNSFVTTEIMSNDNTAGPEEDSEKTGPVEEVEVNIVKTVLPDDSYLISEAGGRDEKIQDDVISMIQNSQDIEPESSMDSLFISRYLQTPEE